jgi:glycerol uptake facilitator-like aquaporin
VPWLVISIVLSVVLTVFLNVGLRAFPNASRDIARRLAKLASPAAGEALKSDRRVRVWIPWKAMILGSVILTIVLNLVLWFARD